MESRTLRYRTNVPFCNACSEVRDSHREVILILKLAYRTNLSGWKLFFSCEIFLRDHRKIVSIRTSHEKCDDRHALPRKSNVLSRKVERQIPISVLSTSLFYTRRRFRTGKYQKLFQSVGSRYTVSTSDRRSDPST